MIVKLLKKLMAVAPVLVLCILLYDEWQSALYMVDSTAHYAHLGGALGAWLYLK